MTVPGNALHPYMGIGIPPTPPALQMPALYPQVQFQLPFHSCLLVAREPLSKSPLLCPWPLMAHCPGCCSSPGGGGGGRGAEPQEEPAMVAEARVEVAAMGGGCCWLMLPESSLCA